MNTGIGKPKFPWKETHHETQKPHHIFTLVWRLHHMNVKKKFKRTQLHRCASLALKETTNFKQKKTWRSQLRTHANNPSVASINSFSSSAKWKLNFPIQRNRIRGSKTQEWVEQPTGLEIIRDDSGDKFLRSSFLIFFFYSASDAWLLLCWVSLRFPIFCFYFLLEFSSSVSIFPWCLSSSTRWCCP